MRYILLLSTLIVICAGFLECFAASEMKPAVAGSNPKESLSIEDARPIEDEYRLYAYYAAAAFRQNDFSYCTESKYPDRCVAQARVFYTLSYLSKNECTQIKDPVMSQVCDVMQNHCRGANSKGVEAICKAIQEKDGQLLVKVCRAPEIAYYGVTDKKIADELLNFYEGFVTKDPAVCSMNSDDPYVKNVCTILFDSDFSMDNLPALMAKVHEEYKKTLEKKFPGRYVN